MNIEFHRRLTPPVPGGSMLVRGRLLERLRARWQTPATVVSAPAGYGKTTLLAQALATDADADADADETMGIDLYLACSPDMAAASALGDGLLRALDADASRSLNGSVDDLVRRVVDAMWRRSPQHVALLLDDVHEIPTGSEGARLLETVIVSLPANGHLVLAGRQPPSLLSVRIEAEDDWMRLGQGELAFTPAEAVNFAALRGVPSSTVTPSGGWPALAEMYASAGIRTSAAEDYVGEEVVAKLPATRRRALGLLAHLGPFDSETARAVLGADVDVRELLGNLPLVTARADVEWSLHGLWTSWLAQEVSPTEVAEARHHAGAALLRRGRVAEAARLLIEAEAWDDLEAAVVEALGVAHPPVARDVLGDWYAHLPAEIQARPAGRLLAAVITSESDPDDARQQLEDCATAFRSSGEAMGEFACLVQLGHMARWAEDVDRLAAAVARAFELEAEGLAQVVPVACLARALQYDIENDRHRMLDELDRIERSSLNDAWWGIVSWARAVGLLKLGRAPEAQEAAEEALRHAETMHAPLAETTKLQAQWYQGNVTETLAVLPAALERIKRSGYSNQTALVACQCAITHAYAGQAADAARYLAHAQAAATVVADSPQLDTSISITEAAVALAERDEQAAAGALVTNVARHSVRQGISAGPQQRHLALFYVLVPSTRPVWDQAELGPVWAVARDLARAVVATRERGRLPTDLSQLPEPGVVRAHLPAPWVAELGVAAVAARHDAGWPLLDLTWPVTHPSVAHLADGPHGSLRTAARTVLARFAAPPDRPLELRLLGPVELRQEGTPVQVTEWRRERVRSLLAYLALHGTVSRRQLARDLWPKLDPEAQSNNLRVTLTYLLRVLEPRRGKGDASFFLRQHGSTISLQAGDSLTVDLWDFDTHCEQADEADKEGSPGVALDRALAAVELWRGEPVELVHESWAIAPVEQRRHRFVAMATRAGELLLAHGDADRAQSLAERALEIDPWLEAAHRLVVASHHARGHIVAARRALLTYREAIHELGLDPEQATLMVERLLDTAEG